MINFHWIMCKKSSSLIIREHRKLPNSLNLSTSSGFEEGTSIVGWLLEDSLPNLPFFNFQTIHEPKKENDGCWSGRKCGKQKILNELELPRQRVNEKAVGEKCRNGSLFGDSGSRIINLTLLLFGKILEMKS